MLSTNDRTVYNEEQELFREQVRKFFDAKLHPHLARWEEEEIVDRQFWLDCGEVHVWAVVAGVPLQPSTIEGPQDWPRLAIYLGGYVDAVTCVQGDRGPIHEEQ